MIERHGAGRFILRPLQSEVAEIRNKSAFCHRPFSLIRDNKGARYGVVFNHEPVTQKIPGDNMLENRS
jgi:hypothetical protein